MLFAFFLCLSMAAVRENRATKTGDCYRANKGAFNHSGFNNNTVYVFNGVRNTCIVAVLERTKFNQLSCSSGSRPSIGVEDDNIRALAAAWNSSDISQLWYKGWYVKMDVGIVKRNCWILNSSNFATIESFEDDCVDYYPFICQYQFNYDCAYQLTSSSQSNSTRFLFPSDYRYSKGQETRIQNGGCFYTVPTIDKSNKNPTFTTCSATCATGNGTPPIRFAASNGIVEIFTCNTNVSCDPAVSSTASGMDMDLLIAVMVLVFAILCLSAVVFFVCYKRKQKKQKKATFRRRINSKISFTTENQPTSTDTRQDDPHNQSRTNDSLKSILGNSMKESNRGFIKTTREIGAKGSAKKSTKKLPVKAL